MTEKEEQVAKLIKQFKERKISRINFVEKLRKLGIDFPETVICQWELE